MDPMGDQYQDCLDFTLGREGGWYDGSRADDPNPTMYGIIQTNYDTYRDGKSEPRQSVQLVSQPEVQDFYTYYYTRSGAAICGPLGSMAVFDAAVNCGEVTAAKLLQRALGVAEDGNIGAQTQAAIVASDDRSLCTKVCWERLRHYLAIVEAKPVDLPDLPSWLQRVLVLREQHLKQVGL
jgi:lysozyme family protein